MDCRFTGHDWFDNFVLVSNTDNVIIPLMHKDKGKSAFIKQNLSKVINYIESAQTAENINSKKESAIEEKEPEKNLADEKEKIVSAPTKKKAK